MSDLLIFLVGIVVTGLTLAAMVMVGLTEASDPRQSKDEELTGWERTLVESKREAIEAYERPDGKQEP